MLDSIPLKLPPKSTLKPGDLVAVRETSQECRIRGLIAKGGQGEVYLGEMVGTGKLVAVKTTSVRLLGDEKTALRAQWETVMLRRLQNRHVVAIHGTGVCPNGAPFMVMELLIGMTLSELRATFGRIPIVFALEIVRDACLGLEAVHDLAIHRDIKPGNLHLGADGVTRVFDLGASKWKDSTERVTTTGMLVGTYAYMAPEQLDDSAPLDARTDLWALGGVVLYELLADRHPFATDGKLAVNSNKLAQQIIHDPHVPLLQVAPLVPDFVRFIVDQALEKDKRKRFPSAGEMAMVIDGALVRFRAEHEASPPLSQLAERMFPDGYMRLPNGLSVPVPQRATRTTVPMSTPATSQPTALPYAPTEPVVKDAMAAPQDVPAEAAPHVDAPLVEAPRASNVFPTGRDEPSIEAAPLPSPAVTADRDTPSPVSAPAADREPWLPAAPAHGAVHPSAIHIDLHPLGAPIGTPWHVPTRHMGTPPAPAPSAPVASSSAPMQAPAVVASVAPRPARAWTRAMVAISIVAMVALSVSFAGSRMLPPAGGARPAPTEPNVVPVASGPSLLTPATAAPSAPSVPAVEPDAPSASASAGRAAKLAPKAPHPRPWATSAPAASATPRHRYLIGVEQ